MCLVTEQKKAKRLNEDLVVYKAMEKVEGDLRSPCQWYIYKKNKLYKTKMTTSTRYEGYADMEALQYYAPILPKTINVVKGFHSFATIERAVSWVEHNNDLLVKFIIPKGSLIFKDKTGLIVSNQIKLIEIVK